MEKKTVLIIDDSYSMRNLLKKALKEANYEIVGEAKNGAEGISFYFDRKPDIVTMDINMPIMSGIEATKEILKKDPFAKIIIITGDENKEKKDQLISIGAIEYIKKPFQANALLVKLEKIFEKEESIKEVTKKMIEAKKNEENQIIVIKNNNDLDDELLNENTIPIIVDEIEINIPSVNRKIKNSEEEIKESIKIANEENQKIKEIFKRSDFKNYEEIDEKNYLRDEINLRNKEKQQILQQKEDKIENKIINIRPPRTRFLENENIEQPESNNSKDKIYNIDNKGNLFNKIKQNLFKIKGGKKDE